MSDNNNQNFDAALTAFVANAQALVNENNQRLSPNLPPDLLSIDPGGKKFIRIVKTAQFGTSRSVYCFIEKATGNVLKAESWKRPAKHARGTIYGPPEGYGVTPYGANYL